MGAIQTADGPLQSPSQVWLFAEPLSLTSSVHLIIYRVEMSEVPLLKECYLLVLEICLSITSPAFGIAFLLRANIASHSKGF